MVVSSRHGCRERHCASRFAIMTSSMKVCMVVFQLKGSALLWWKMLLPLLNMVVDDVSWELFEGWFRRGIFLRNSLSISSTSSMPCDKVAAWCPSTRPILELLRYAPHQVTQKLKVNKFEFGLIVRIQLLLGYQDYWTEESVLDCGEPHYQHDCLEERTRASGSAGPTTMGVWARPIRFMQW
jgi:hypothetical protein